MGKCGANADASFKNLPPGEYRLKVRSSIDATAESGVESVLPIVVYHPWYARPWAMVCYALLFVIIVAIILVRYHKVMLRKHREIGLSCIRMSRSGFTSIVWSFYKHYSRAVFAPDNDYGDMRHPAEEHG